MGRSGDRMRVVLAPGLLCDARLWAPVRERLSAPSVVADFSGDATLPQMGERLLAIAPERFVLAGFSMGAMAAILAAASAPARVAGLALIDGHADADTPERAAARARHMAIAEAGGFDALVAEELKPAYFAEPAAFAEERALVAAMARSQGAERFGRHVAAILARPDLAAAAARIRAPTTVVVGALDTLATPQAARRLAALIPGARLVELEGCGHLAPVERPAEVAALIDALTDTLAVLAPAAEPAP